MTLHLYELVDQYKTLMQVIDDTSAAPEDFQLYLAKITDQLERKVEHIAKFCISIQANVEAIKLEEVRLTQRRQSLEKKDAWLRQYLLAEMVAVGTEQVKRDTVTVSVRTNPPSVEVLDLDAVPQEFRRLIPETWQVERKLILEHFKATGEILDGVSIVTDKKRIEIR